MKYAVRSGANTLYTSDNYDDAMEFVSIHGGGLDIVGIGKRIPTRGYLYAMLLFGLLPMLVGSVIVTVAAYLMRSDESAIILLIFGGGCFISGICAIVHLVAMLIEGSRGHDT